MPPIAGDKNDKERNAQRFCMTEQALDGAKILEENEFHRTVLCRLLERLHRHFGAERAVAVFTNEQGELKLKAARHFEIAGTGQLSHVISRTVVEDVAERQAPVLVQDALNDPMLRDQTSVMEQGLRSIMCVPLLAAGDVLGVIYMDNLNESGNFTSPDLETLNLVASYAAASLHGARLVCKSSTNKGEATENAVEATDAGLAHNFKNVLTAIQTRLRLSEQAHEQLQQELAKAHEAVEVGREHVREIAVDARSASGHSSIVDLAEILRESLDMMRDRMQADETSYDFQVNIPDSASVRGHKAQLREVFINLLSNAMDAMGSQGTLALSLNREEQEWVARVGDTGSGIPEKHRDQLFDPFFTTKGTSGMGLGLHMVRSTVESHRGSISVTSDQGEGTEVTVRLPAD